MAKCLHGMEAIFCARCSNPPPVRKPRIPVKSLPSESERDPSDLPMGKLMKDGGYAVVQVQRGRSCMDHFHVDTTFVHINGHPYLWLIQALIEKGKNLKVIQVIPSMHEMLGARTRMLCEEAGIIIQPGHHRPELAWDEHESRSPDFERQRQFLLNLKGEQKELFDEIVAMGFEYVLYAKRYFCLENEPRLSIRLLNKEWGLTLKQIHYSSGCNLAVLKYLDPSMEVGELSRLKAEALHRHVIRLRPYVQNLALRQDHAKRLGLPSLPERLPIARLPTLEALILAIGDGRMRKLLIRSARIHSILLARFGLFLTNPLTIGSCRTLQDIGDAENLTRERVRQLEADGLEFLGIEAE